MRKDQLARATGEEPPPVGGSWPRLYALVVGVLAALVVLFHLFGRAFS